MSDPQYPIGKFSPPSEYTPELRTELIAQIAEAPARLRQATSGLSIEERRTPYRDGGWTVAQVVHHLADSHLNAYARVKLALTEDNPTIKTYDENKWAALPDASHAEIENSLTFLDALHGRWVHVLRELQPDDFARPWVHPERGPMTIDRTVALYAWHGRHHVAHITTLRERMGW